MQANQVVAAVLAVVAVSNLLSCSGDKDSVDPNEVDASIDFQVPKGLPPLAELPEPERNFSAIPADGFLPIDPLYPLETGNAVNGGGFLHLDNGINVLTYALYGVSGFDGDNYPVSVKLDVADGGGQFYVAFSDYRATEWQISGPFSGDGEYGIPALDGYDDPEAFTSGKRCHYFAVIVPNGNAVDLLDMWLGVSGGDSAPDTIWGLSGEGSANGFYLRWMPSSSFNDPDFAGYIVERAPQYSGGFTPLAGAPSPVPAFEDSGAVVGEQYRYRVVTYDFSGNHSVGPVNITGPALGSEADPVIIVDMPRGPLYGPVTVHADLSASFDPEGEGITTYSLAVFNPAPTSFAGPAADIPMQPGCQLLACHVECADGRNVSQYFYIKILPQWEPASEILRATDPTLTYKDARLQNFKAGVQPGDGRLTVCGFDSTAYALTCWHHDGSQLVPHRAKTFEQITYVGEPVVDGDALLFPVSSLNTHAIASFDGEQLLLKPGADFGSGESAIALVKDNAARRWLVYPGFNGGDKLYIRQDAAGAVESEAASVTNNVVWLDAVFDPASGHIFAFFDDMTALTYVEWNPDTQLPVSGGPVGVANVAFLMDAEINPENGRIGVMTHDVPSTRNIYIEQDGMGGWTAPALIDNSVDNIPEGGLCPSDGGKLNAFFALDNGQQAHRYVLDAGVWSVANTVAYATDSGHEATLSPVPGSPDVRVVDNCGDGVIRIARLGVGNTENVFATIDSALGQGYDMHAARGTDGLHLIFSNVHTFNTVRHMLSPAGPDEGSVWVEANGFTATSGLNLEGTSMGEVYATGYEALSSTLYYWDGVNFLNDQALVSQPDYRPILGPGMMSSDVVFAAWDNIGGALNYIEGNHSSYNAPLASMPTINPVWDGTYWSSISAGGFFMLAGGSADTPNIGINLYTSNYFNLLGNVLAGGEVSPYDKMSLAGRVVDSCNYWNGRLELGGFGTEMLAASGLLFNPMRYEQSIYNEITSTELPMSGIIDGVEMRRSACSQTMNGLTAVELVSTLGGEQTYFAWSNYGNWEELELPPGMDGMSLPLILCGNDGRWHIIYKNWKTDAIMIRSTI